MDLAENSWPPIQMTNIDEEYLCPLCKNILIQVHQTYDCGCRFCLECLKKVMENGNGSCPSCDSKLYSNTKVPDKFFQKKINRIPVKCQYKEHAQPCEWKGILMEYKDHYNEHFVPKIRNCEYCHLEFVEKDKLDEHLDEKYGTCPEQPILCPYSEIDCFINANSVGKNIINDSVTSMNTTPTAFEFKQLKRKELEHHMVSNYSYHLDLVFKNLNSRLGKLEGESSDASSVSSFSINAKSNMNSQSTDDYGYSGTGSVNSVSQNIDNIEFDAGLFYDTKIGPKIDDANTKLDLLEINQKNLINDLTRITHTNEVLQQENSKFKELIKEYKSICHDLHRTLALTQVNLLTIEEKMKNLESTSYDGTLLWKIKNVNERMQDAKNGRQTSFYSPPFYTQRNGYKLCARIYLNGDGSGRNTHISLFFVILKGEYDALLSWPFKQKCSFILLDQSSARENISDAFRPDPNSASFQQPTSEMNLASGLPLFCPISKLLENSRAYFKDNTMFLKIIVDTKDLDVT